MPQVGDWLDDYRDTIIRPLREQLRDKEREAFRYKDALYHIAYRGADPQATALEALGDVLSSPDESELTNG